LGVTKAKGEGAEASPLRSKGGSKKQIAPRLSLKERLRTRTGDCVGSQKKKRVGGGGGGGWGVGGGGVCYPNLISFGVGLRGRRLSCHRGAVLISYKGKMRENKNPMGKERDQGIGVIKGRDTKHQEDNQRILKKKISDLGSKMGVANINIKMK